MKLFLASSADKTLESLKTLVPNIGKRVLFMPNAADPYTEKWWVDLDRERFKALGYEVTELDLKNTTKDQFESALGNADILHFCGGSVSYLASLIKEKDIADTITEAVKGNDVVYTGTSAGSMVVSEELSMLSYDEEEEKAYMHNGFNKKGLGLITFGIVPHCNSEDFTEERKKVAGQMSENLQALIFLHDNQAVWVENDTFKIIEV